METALKFIHPTLSEHTHNMHFAEWEGMRMQLQQIYRDHGCKRHAQEGVNRLLSSQNKIKLHTMKEILLFFYLLDTAVEFMKMVLAVIQSVIIPIIGY